MCEHVPLNTRDHTASASTASSQPATHQAVQVQAAQPLPVEALGEGLERERLEPLGTVELCSGQAAGGRQAWEEGGTDPAAMDAVLTSIQASKVQ